MPIHTESKDNLSQHPKQRQQQQQQHAVSAKEQLLSLAASEGDLAIRRRRARLSTSLESSPAAVVSLRSKQRSLSDASSSFSSALSSSTSPPSSPILPTSPFSSFSPKPRTFSSSSGSSTASSSSSLFRPVAHSVFFALPDPTVDVSRLRVRSRSQHALYPGATFSGTQKSGRNSYNVTVTIVDVDMDSSHLSGYLCINGLTEDWPELTTYFDAEIIGERHGFLTQKWGASEAEDLTHWGRFPAFRHVKHDLKRPGLTMKEREREKRGVVFMRWKEKFLVPDHKVKNITGASFAGFYYVCVEFNPSSYPPSQHHRSASQPVNPYASGNKSNLNADSVDVNRAMDGTATMTGFYYHQNSEPYQQLSLSHIPEQTTGAFEFR